MSTTRTTADILVDLLGQADAYKDEAYVSWSFTEDSGESIPKLNDVVIDGHFDFHKFAELLSEHIQGGRDDDEPGVALARESVASAHPQVIAGAKVLAEAHRTPWDLIGPQQQFTYCCDARAVIHASLLVDGELRTAARAQREDRTATWGTCSNQACLTSMVIYPHADRQTDLPDEEEWDTPEKFIDCPVCDSRMDWGGTDHPADIIINY